MNSFDLLDFLQELEALLKKHGIKCLRATDERARLEIVNDNLMYYYFQLEYMPLPDETKQELKKKFKSIQGGQGVKH